MLSDIGIVRCLWKSSVQADVDDGCPIRIVIFIDMDNVVNMIVQGADIDDESWYSRDANSYAQAVEYAVEGMLFIRKLYPTIAFTQRVCPESKSLEEALRSA